MAQTEKKLYEDQRVLDARNFLVAYRVSLFNVFRDVEIHLTQREIRMIIKHLEKRNDKLTNKLKDLIKNVDEQEQRFTNWNERVPKTAIIRH